MSTKAIIWIATVVMLTVIAVAVVGLMKMASEEEDGDELLEREIHE